MWFNIVYLISQYLNFKSIIPSILQETKFHSNEINNIHLMKESFQKLQKKEKLKNEYSSFYYISYIILTIIIIKILQTCLKHFTF